MWASGGTGIGIEKSYRYIQCSFFHLYPIGPTVAMTIRLATRRTSMTTHRQWFTWLVSGLATLAVGHISGSEAGELYPVRPVSIITQAPVGVGPDVIARLVADRLARVWHRQVLVVNRPGAGGLIALQAAA